MKRFLTIAVVTLALIFTASIKNPASAQPGVNVDISYQDFYDELSPYGEWIDYPDYGYVWRPSGIQDFQPYSTNGHWVWSDEYEWMWVSDYNWGWAPFHYGRWFSDPNYGWMWMPGYEWGPAWVAWRDGGDYYGWAPLRPGFNLSVNISLGSYNPPVDYWCFAPRRYISSHRIYDYCMPRRQNITIINNTTIINNYGRRGGNVFAQGPRRNDAERYAGRIRSVRFRDANTPGSARVRNNEVSVYRPNIRRDNNSRSFAPRQFERYNRNDAARNNATAGRNGNTNSRVGNTDRATNDRRGESSRQSAATDNRTTERRQNGFDRNRITDRTTNTDRRVREEANRNENNNRVTERRNGFEPSPNRRNNTNNETRTNPVERRNNNNEFRQRSENRRAEQPVERRNQSFERPNSNNNPSSQRFERRTETCSQQAPKMNREQRQAPARQFESRGAETRTRETRSDNGGANRSGNGGRRIR